MATLFLDSLFSSIAEGRFLSISPMDLVGYILSIRLFECLSLKSSEERISKDIIG